MAECVIRLADGDEVRVWATAAEIEQTIAAGRAAGDDGLFVRPLLERELDDAPLPMSLKVTLDAVRTIPLADIAAVEPVDG